MTLLQKGLLETALRKLCFARKDTVIYTNLGTGGPIDRRLEEAGKGSLIQTESVIETHYGRDRDELVHRALKDFGTETNVVSARRPTKK